MDLHKIFHLERPLFVIDVETTGTDVMSDRVVEIGFQEWTDEGLVKEYKTLVRIDGPMSEKAEKVHGISLIKLHSCRICGHINTTAEHPGDHAFKPWPTFAQLAASLAKGFTECDFAGKNVRFDLRILESEMARANQPWSYMSARIIDAERLEQIGEPRSLSHLYKKHLGHSMVGAHEALSDVRGTAELIAAQMRTYQSSLPRDLTALHDLQWPGWSIDSGGKFKFIDGVPCCMFGKWAGKPMKSIDVSYWDWILKNNFPADIKALAEQAKLGKFPKPR